MWKELNVEQVLVGTLKIEGEKVRVNVELVDTKRGFNIWGKSYNKTIESCFEVQDEIAADIAEQLKVGLAERTVPASRRNEPRNSESSSYQWGGFLKEITGLARNKKTLIRALRCTRKLLIWTTIAPCLILDWGVYTSLVMLGKTALRISTRWISITNWLMNMIQTSRKLASAWAGCISTGV
jgi:hypothetical protein